MGEITCLQNDSQRDLLICVFFFAHHCQDRSEDDEVLEGV